MKVRFSVLSLVLSASFLYSFIAVADEVRPITKPVKIISSADDHPVEAETVRNVYATGMIYARPTRGKPHTGIIFKTDELHLIVGNFQDDNKYAGNTKDVSTKSRAVFDKIDKLDTEKHYLFSYWYSYPLHFNMQDSSYMITAVQDTPAPVDFASTGLPMEFDVQGGRVGWQTGSAQTTGRMVEVMRWNTYILGRPICTFTLDQGGSKRSAQHAVANEMDFNIYSEEGCKYVENILPFGLELKVNYSESYISFDGSDLTAHSIMVDRIPGVRADRPIAINSGPIAQEILNDPEFQAGIGRLIDEYWLKQHPQNPKP
jgi:hypothetical protein